jgi:D-glycero-alpha-D-manno-heptose-7-phosphate kinase
VAADVTQGHAIGRHYNARVRVTSSAPARIDLAGGTIDIWPLYLFHEGAQTLNAAISLRASCSIASRTDSRITITSADTGQTLEVERWSDLPETTELRLVGRALHFFRVDGVDVETKSDSPVGAGIGGSSALDVALCGALAEWTGRELGPEELLAIAMNIEAQVIRVPTGVQDYRPARYGGVAAVELGVDGVRRVPLDVDAGELERRLVLAYTGASRSSGLNNWAITKRHIDGDEAVTRAFDRIRDIAAAMRAALAAGDWPEVSRQIAAEWETRKQLAPGVTTPAIDGLIGRARSAGATAAKVCGAGGGGCLFCFAEPGAAPGVRAALADGGARVIDFRIDPEGLRVDAEPDGGGR